MTTAPDGTILEPLSKQEENEREQYEQFVRSMLGGGLSSANNAAVVNNIQSATPTLATDSKHQIQQDVYRQLIIDTIAAKYNGAVDEAAAAAAARALGGANESVKEESGTTGTVKPNPLLILLINL